MKTVTIIIRTLIGLLLVSVAIGYFLKLMPEPVTNGDFKAFNVGVVSSEYIMPMAKFVELLCGLAFIFDLYVTLASILILPIILNILFLDYYLTPEAMPIAIFLFLGNFFLIYKHWDNYKSIFSLK
ncbi:DoxX family protein [Flavobacterium soyangense]|uniref:DoxX family protein n=1 Tax=Flavobacterium soyangense TaxID=2023265 RepID=A0A930UDS8_9FLAO|nr:DoxX family protein [Flavobacterium soyangense]MBF2709481.1 DoxX family protein [Flavobacterium soyangense]